MRFFLGIALPVCFLFVLTGCWDQFELTEFGFVQAVAIDITKQGNFELTTHFYKPASGDSKSPGGGKENPSAITIKTEARTINEAIQNMMLQLGRKAKWDHMRIIIIGESLVKKTDIRNILDFFRRNHEVRATTLLMITKGKASDYLDIKPFIEQTMGQQFREIEKTASSFTAKTVKTNLLDLALQLRSEVGIGVVPYTYISKEDNHNNAVVSGLAVLKKGKMVSLISSKETESLLMLINKYERGMIEIPCNMNNKKRKKELEAVEIRDVKTKTTPVIQGNSLTIHVSSKMEGSITELRCSSLLTESEVNSFNKKFTKTVEDDLQKLITHLQKNKIDVLGIGNQIYNQKPAAWEKWKNDWDQHFADSRFEIKVDGNILNTGMNIGKPSSQ
ncbi:Ger(x)C family spore germination protein [Ectobacillus funiculus]|uniref:Ger(x)C family spore germination protein n=1 Tax=Ectobacillus funiculus TaxID=137993 RepID=UPI00397DD9B0